MVVDRLPIQLSAFLKLAGAAATGGQAKALIQTGLVTVNGHTETRRHRMLGAGDRITLRDTMVWTVAPLPPA